MSIVYWLRRELRAWRPKRLNARTGIPTASATATEAATGRANGGCCDSEDGGGGGGDGGCGCWRNGGGN